jgi:hypothetical protein
LAIPYGKTTGEKTIKLAADRPQQKETVNRYKGKLK